MGGSSKEGEKRFADVFWLKKTIALVGNMRFSLPTIMQLVDSSKKKKNFNDLFSRTIG